MRRMSAELVKIKTNLRYKLVDIVIGHSFEFVANKGQFLLDRTPYSEPTLVPISDVEVESTCMHFNVANKGRSQKYAVDFIDFPEGQILAELIRQTNAGQGFNLAFTSNNDIDYQSELEDEEDGIEGSSFLALSNVRHESIWFSDFERRIIHVQDETQVPAKVVNAAMGALILTNNNLTFEGQNVQDESEFHLAWKLDFPDSIAEEILGLVRTLVKNVS